MASSAWIKNTTGGDKTWVGQLISAGAYYQIQDVERVQWANNSLLLTDIGSGDAVVARDDSGSNDISDVNQAINHLKEIPAELDNKGSPIIRPKAFSDTEGMRFRGTGISGTATKNSSTNHDYNLPEDRYLNGVELLLENHQFDDTVKFQVVDVDGVVYPAGTVLDEFATDWHIASDTERQGPYILPYPALVYSWMYIRIVYTSTGTVDDVKFKANLFLHKKPV